MRLTPLIATIRLPSSMPAFSAGLLRITVATSRPSVSREPVLFDVETPITARGLSIPMPMTAMSPPRPVLARGEIVIWAPAAESAVTARVETNAVWMRMGPL